MIPFQMRANIIVIFSSFLKYISVCFISPAPIHCPITVIKTGPMVTHTRATIDQILWATPLAAIWQVPNNAITLESATFTSWKTPLSIPFGTAMRRIFFADHRLFWKSILSDIVQDSEKDSIKWVYQRYSGYCGLSQKSDDKNVRHTD